MKWFWISIVTISATGIWYLICQAKKLIEEMENDSENENEYYGDF